MRADTVSWRVWLLGMALVTIGLAVATACSTGASPTATSIDIPTSVPTPPPYWPTFADFVMADKIRSSNPVVLRIYADDYAHFAAIYVARECFAGIPLTPEGFWSFVDQTLGMESTTDTVWGRAGTDLDKVLAKQIIGKILALGGKDVRGSCIEPYLYPKSGAEAVLGASLVSGATDLSPVAAQFLPGVLLRRSTDWFQQEAQTREPFVPWLWTLTDASKTIDLPISDNIPVPLGNTQLPPTWALEYQLGMLEAEIRTSAADAR